MLAARVLTVETIDRSRPAGLVRKGRSERNDDDDDDGRRKREAAAWSLRGGELVEVGIVLFFLSHLLSRSRDSIQSSTRDGIAKS